MSIQTRAPGCIDLEPPACPAVAAAGAAMLAQCAAFVRALSDGAYVCDSSTHKGGTIGKHVRHVLDHFRAALEQGCAGETIDYDRRARNVPMETDRGAAIEAVESVRGRLAALREQDLDRPVRIRVMLAGDGTEAELRSTLGRELAFAAHHAVHHHAMVKAMAAEFGLDAGEHFGKAPSTLRHQQDAR